LSPIVTYNFSMTAVLMLRHPQTTWNARERYQGRLDSPLSDEGRAQIQPICRLFAGDRLDAVFSSPLIRALDLASPIAQQTNAPLIVDNRLIEMAQGPWEGLYLDEVHHRHRDLYSEWYNHPERVCFPRGESASMVQRRAACILQDIYGKYGDGRVAVVTHSVVIQTLACAALSLELHHLHRLRIANCSVTTLCGTELPGSLLTLNSTEALYSSPIQGAAEQNCIRWKQRRVTT